MIEFSGSGERKLYIGGDAGGKISRFFESDDVDVVILKDQLMDYLSDHITIFRTGFKKFRKGASMKDVWQQNIVNLSTLPDEIEFILTKVDVVGDRYYATSEHEIFDYMRDILIPDITVLRFYKPLDHGLKFEIKVMAKSEVEDKKSVNHPEELEKCQNEINSKWEFLENGYTIVENFQNPFGLVSYFMQRQEGIYLGFDQEKRKMILKHVITEVQISDFHEYVTSILNELGLNDLLNNIEMLQHVTEERYFSVVVLLATNYLNNFETLICNLLSSQFDIDNHIVSRSRLRDYHRKFNQQASQITNQLFQNNPNEFLNYHREYRKSRQGNYTSFEYMADFVNRYHNDESKIIADFGCGEAKLAQLLYHNINSDGKKHVVINIDHFDFSKLDNVEDPVPNYILIHEADYSNFNKANEIVKQYVPDDIGVDIAVFSLSLWGVEQNSNQSRSGITMGLSNAQKLLNFDGEIHIIESCSRFGISRSEDLVEIIDDIYHPFRNFITLLENIGFGVDIKDVLDLNLREESLYTRSNKRFVHIFGQKSRYRLPNESTDIVNAFRSKPEEVEK